MIAPGVARAIDRQSVAVSLTTKTAGDTYNDDGTINRGATTTAEIKAVIQPIAGSFSGRVGAGESLKDVIEGLREEAAWVLWSRNELKMDDRIAYGDINLRIVYVWPRAEGDFWRALGADQ